MDGCCKDGTNEATGECCGGASHASAESTSGGCCADQHA
jgi:hypothetical protein